MDSGGSDERDLFADEPTTADAQSPADDPAFQELENEFDDSATDFLAVEEQLSDVSGTGANVNVDVTHAYVTGVERIPMAKVPPGYPLDISTDEALRFTVELDEGTEDVYLEFPEEVTTHTQLARLCAALNLPLSSFADIYGKDIPIVRARGHFVPYVPPETTEVSPNWYYGVLAALAAWMGFLIAEIFVNDVSQIVYGLLVLSWLLFPLATYLDAKYVRAKSTWDPNAVVWTIGAATPYCNVFSGLAYVYKRYDALFFT
jgi:hypothetical protein